MKIHCWFCGVPQDETELIPDYFHEDHNDYELDAYVPYYCLDCYREVTEIREIQRQNNELNGS